jgi:hypothetical protein
MQKIVSPLVTLKPAKTPVKASFGGQWIPRLALERAKRPVKRIGAARQG